jgi:hypothetical protein
MNQKREMTRREFVKDAAIASVSAGAAITIVPRHVLGKGMTPPSDLLNIAGVGIGGMGRTNLINLASQNIVALCDVDWGYAEKGFAQLDNMITGLNARIAAPDPESQSGKAAIPFDREQAKARLAGMQRLKDVHLPKAKRYTDYREMLQKQKDIEGVLIATPDHMHAPIALAAMELGKHVYVQKPLTWCVAETRQLARTGNQSRDADGQPGTFAGRCAQSGGIRVGRRDWRSPRNSYLDEPATGILAAGSAASREVESARG